MTRFEAIKNMSQSELANFLENQIAEGPWIDWFGKKYCDSCENIKLLINERVTDAKFCEVIEDGCMRCRYFSDYPENVDIIEMWLKEEI